VKDQGGKKYGVDPTPSDLDQSTRDEVRMRSRRTADESLRKVRAFGPTRCKRMKASGLGPACVRGRTRRASRLGKDVAAAVQVAGATKSRRPRFRIQDCRRSVFDRPARICHRPRSRGPQGGEPCAPRARTCDEANQFLQVPAKCRHTRGRDLESAISGVIREVIDKTQIGI